MTVLIGPDFELQKIVNGILSGDTDIQSLIGTPPRIYEVVPPNAAFPYVTIGESQVIPDQAECIDGSQVIMTFHIWSRDKSGFGEAKKIAATIWGVLSAGDYSGTTENRIVIFDRDPLGDQTLLDADTVTKHIVQHFRALMEPL